MNDALHSRSDLEALRRSGRGKVVVLGLVFIAAIAAAAWSFLRPGGTGNAEELNKVIVVSATSGRSIPLADMGFDAAEGNFAAWVRKAEDEVPDLDVTGIEAIMALADRFGYAWVIFEDPKDVDFSALDIEGGVAELPEHVRFAVLSAGELAFPHKMTVNPKPSEVVRGSTTLMLQALFAQEPMAEALPDNESPSMQVIKLRDRVGDAIERVARVPEAERMAEKIVVQVQELLSGAERAEPKPQSVGEKLEVTTPVPLANGKVLSIAQSFKLVSRDAVRADLDLEDVEHFMVGEPGAPPSERQPCPGLAGGEVSVHDSAKFWFSGDGGAVLLKTLSGGLSLWTIAADADACGFVNAGVVPAAQPGMGGGAPVPAGASGRVARAGEVDGRGVVSVVRAGSDEHVLLGMIDGVTLSRPQWIGERFIIAAADPYAGQADGLVLLDVEQPMLALALPAGLFSGATVIAELGAGGTAADPVIAVVTADDERRVSVLRPGPLAKLFETPPVDAILAETEPDAVRNEREGLPTVVLLDTNAFSAHQVTDSGGPRNLVVSPNGARVAFRLQGNEIDPTEPGDAEIAVAQTAKGSGGVRLVTLNALKDHSPRFSADGAHLMFRTRFDVPRTKWVITAGRIASL